MSGFDGVETQMMPLVMQRSMRAADEDPYHRTLQGVETQMMPLVMQRSMRAADEDPYHRVLLGELQDEVSQDPAVAPQAMEILRARDLQTAVAKQLYSDLDELCEPRGRPVLFKRIAGELAPRLRGLGQFPVVGKDIPTGGTYSQSPSGTGGTNTYYRTPTGAIYQVASMPAAPPPPPPGWTPTPPPMPAPAPQYPAAASRYQPTPTLAPMAPAPRYAPAPQYQPTPTSADQYVPAGEPQVPLPPPPDSMPGDGEQPPETPQPAAVAPAEAHVSTTTVAVTKKEGGSPLWLLILGAALLG